MSNEPKHQTSSKKSAKGRGVRVNKQTIKDLRAPESSADAIKGGIPKQPDGDRRLDLGE